MGRPKALADRLNIGTKDEMEVMGFRLHKVKLALTVVLTICTGGLLLILITWKPSIKLSLTHKRCPLQEATKLLLKDIYHQLWEEVVVEEDVPEGEGKETRKRLYFINRKMKYVWDETTFTYARLRPVELGSTFHSFHRQASGLSDTDAKSKKLLYGDNFMKIESLSIWQLLVQQAVNPFYIFQAYTVILWCLQEYYLFSGCILSLSVISISVMVYETRRQTCALRKRITTESEVVVLRDGTRNIISSREIVPGDVVLLKDGLGAMEVDAVLLEGSVVTNEAMLTGESIPVTKVAIPKENDTMFNEEDHKHHLLFSGTEVLQVRGGKELRALVVKTGFYTERGELVRSILFPKPVDIHFYRDFMKMLFLFIFLGLSTMCWSLVHFYYTGASWEEVLFYSLDLVTFVVPPLLPATLTAINIGAQMRLKKHGIFCLSSNYISLSGSVDVVCFDKTGTLTENDLALAGVVSCQRGEMQSPQEDLATLSPDLPLTVALATCHSLTTIDGALAGHPLDIKIFSGIDWTLTEPEAVVNQDYGMVPSLLVQPKHSESIRFPDEHEVAILKTFPFDSKEQRMTVVTRRKTSTNYQVYIKGAPEKIVSICKANSVPDLVETVLEWYTRQGLRVVAVAGASLPSNFTWEQVELTSREQLESGAEFLGLVVLQNKVKLETPSVISTLHQANINTVMITGDNLLTAVSVARQSLLLEAEQQLIVVRAQMVDTSSIAAQHLQVNYYDVDQINGLYDKRKLISVRNDNYVLAADGNTFELIYRGQDRDLFRRLVHKGKIFARMKPDQKMTVVETLQDLGHQVAMCGDGCNDCGALKVADAGISLSSSEASVAAPFTSKYENIDCVPTLIREGRAVLVSIFNAFKYDVSMCFGALICVIFQFLINTMPSDTQYLIMDLILGTMPALVIGMTGAPSQLSPTPPTQRILSILPALSMLSFLGIQTLTYWGVLTYIEAQPWFEPFQFDGEMYPIKPNYENTALILVNFHSFYIGVLVYSHSYPHRKHIYTNYLLSAYLVCAAFFCMFSTFYTGEWMLNLLNFHPFPDVYTPTMIFLAVSISCFVSLIWERWVLYGLLDKYLLPWIHKTCGPHRPFAKIEKELRNTPDWPPLTDPPQLDAPISTKAGRPLTAKESLPFEEDNDDSMLIRKLTRRNKFKASVKYMKDTTYTPSPEVTSPSTVNSPPIQSAGYQVPWDAHQNEGNVFSFNKSVRHQIMQGTGGAFKTFKGSTKKRQRPADTNVAEPYEVIRLTDNNEPIYNDDEIYSTIPDPPPSYTEDVETGVTGNHAGTYGEQEHEVPIYEEGEASKPNTFSGAGSNFEEQPHGGNSIYDVPQPPRPFEKQTRGPAEDVNMGNLPTLMSQLSYIDDEQTESNC